MSDLGELEDLIDPNCPPETEYEKEFFELTIELLKEEKRERKKVPYEAKIFSIAPVVIGAHEGMHYLAAGLLNCKIEKVGFDGVSLYMQYSADPVRASIVDLFPHLLALPAIYYGLFEEREEWLPFLAPTLAELVPYELFQSFGDFLNVAERISPNAAVAVKYLLTGSYLLGAYLLMKYVHNRKRKSEEEGECEE